MLSAGRGLHGWAAAASCSGPYTKASTLGNLFLQECQFFQDYTPFLEGYNNALTLCETLKATNPAFASLLTEFDATRHRNGEMAFESILITPAQRCRPTPPSLPPNTLQTL